MIIRSHLSWNRNERNLKALAIQIHKYHFRTYASPTFTPRKLFLFKQRCRKTIYSFFDRFFFFLSFLLCVCFFCFLFNFIFRIEIIFKREKNHIRVYLCCLIEEPPFLSLFVALMHVLPLYRSIDVICYERSVCMNASKGNKHNNNDIISRNSLFCLFCYFILAFRHRSFARESGKWKYSE